MALNGLLCADVPLRTYIKNLHTHSLTSCKSTVCIIQLDRKRLLSYS